MTNKAASGSMDHQPAVIGAITKDAQPAALVECRSCRRRFAVPVQDYQTRVPAGAANRSLPQDCHGKVD